MSMRWRDLSFRLPLIVLLISLVPLAGFGLFSIQYEMNALLKVRGQGVRRSAVLTAAVVEQSLLQTRQALEHSAGNLGLVDLEAADQEWALMDLLLQLPQVNTLALLDSQGQERVKVAKAKTFFAEDLVSRAEDPLYRNVLGGEHYLAPARRLATGDSLSSLSIPLWSLATQELAAVLVADLQLSHVLDDATMVRIGQKGQTYVIDKQGTLIAHNDMSLALRGEQLQSLGMVDAPTQYVNVEGIDVLGAGIEIAGTDWLLVAELPMTEVTAVANRMRKILYGMLVASALLLTAPMAFFLVVRVSRSLLRLEQGAVQIGAGVFAEPMPVKSGDEIGRMTQAFNEMAANLKHYAAEAEHADWLKSGLGGLDAQLRGTNSLETLANQAVGFLAGYVGAQVGALYARDEAGLFRLAGGYANAGAEADPPRPAFAVGQGLVGQVARDRQLLEVRDLPEGYLSIESGLGSRAPGAVLLLPLVHEGAVLGVVELGKFVPFLDNEKAFLAECASPLAVTVSAVNDQLQLDSALRNAQSLTEELQTQQEELRAANEELEEQTQQLQASEEQLKSQEEELRAANEELQEKTENLEEQQRAVTERNKQLQRVQRELEENARALETSNRYKSEFLANMSHELRTPLNSLLILSRDLMSNKQGNLSEDQVESAEVIYNSGNDLLILINEILDLSKIEAGKMTLNISDVPLVETARRLESSFRHMTDKQGLSLEIVLQEGLPAEIRTDAQRLDQILKNLMSNAIKFTHAGGIKVHFFRPMSGQDLSRSGLDPRQTLGIAVTDTGVGIAADKLETIFEAFQQVDGSTSRQFGGTGLGLSIAREMARLLDGELQLESEEGQGSTFTFFLPLRYDDRSEQAQVPVVASEPAPAEASVPVLPAAAAMSFPRPVSIADDRDHLGDDGRCIVIVEDDPHFAKILGQLCHDKTFRFLHAADGEEGLRLIETFRPDAVFLDLRLPGIQGLDLLDRLKGSRDLRHIPVHVMSVDDKADEACRHGAVGFLNKPVSREALEQAFSRVEQFASGEMRRLLIVEDDPGQQVSIAKLIGNSDVTSTVVSSGQAALEFLQEEQVDCMILDLGLPDQSGFELLRQLDERDDLSVPPTIVYTGRELTREEVDEINHYTSSIVIKGVQSPERLLDEASLFLHRVVAGLPATKQKIITALYDSDELFADKKILLVDDDMRNVFALSRVLDERGMHVSKAANGQKALEILNEYPEMDLVLMDIMMPVMDGYEAMRQIRKQARFASLPILALTAKAMREDRVECIAAGANDYLAKPVDVDRLLSLMRVWLHR